MHEGGGGRIGKEVYQQRIVRATATCGRLHDIRKPPDGIYFRHLCRQNVGLCCTDAAICVEHVDDILIEPVHGALGGQRRLMENPEAWLTDILPEDEDLVQLIAELQIS